jgi:ribose transport system substrate-binding protein
VKKIKILSICLLLIIATTCFAGCGAQEAKQTSEKSEEAQVFLKEGEEIDVVFSVASLSTVLFSEINNRLKSYAEELGNVNLTVYDGEGKTEKQVSDLELAATIDPDLVILLPIDGEGVVPGVKKINEAGIPLIVITRTITQGEYLAYVGVSDLIMGRMAAEYIASKLDGKGKVVEILGSLGVSTTQDRIKGFESVIGNYKDIEIVASQPANWSRAEALTAMENIIQSNPEIDAVFVHNDEMAGGVIEALKSAGMEDVIVVGVMGMKEALQRIEDGTQTATVTMPPDTAVEGLKIGINYLTGKDYESYKMLDIDMITKGNLDAFWEKGY